MELNKQGVVRKVSGPLVVAEGMGDCHMYDVARVGDKHLIGEIIELRGDVAFRPLDPPQYVEIGIATPPTETMSPAARRFLAFVRENIKG